MTHHNPASKWNLLHLRKSSHCPLKILKTVDGMKHKIKKTKLRTGLAPSPSSLPRVVSVRRLGSPCLWSHYQTIGEANCCIVQVTSKDILDQNARGRDVLVQDVMPNTAQRYGAVAEFEPFESQRHPRARKPAGPGGSAKRHHGKCYASSAEQHVRDNTTQGRQSWLVLGFRLQRARVVTGTSCGDLLAGKFRESVSLEKEDSNAKEQRPTVLVS